MEKKCKKSRTVKNRIIIVRIVLLLFVFSLNIPTIISQAASIGTVTASVLNLRKSPNTSSAILGKLTKDTKVSISSETKDSQGTLWYKVTAPVNGKSVTGYVAASFIKKTTPVTSNNSSNNSSKNTYVKRYAKIVKGSVNVRQSTTTSSKSLGVVKLSTTVQVTGWKKNGSTKWYYVNTKIGSKNVKGYIRSDFIQFYPVKVKTTVYKLAQGNTSTYLYKTANTNDAKLQTISSNQQLIVRGTLKVYNTNWTKVISKSSGKNVTGYVLTSRISNLTATAGTTRSDSGYAKVNLTARTMASDITSSRGNLSKGTKVTVLGAVNVSGGQWYKCRYTVSGKNNEGYIKASHITITNDADFESSIAGFPSSYKPALRKLHQTYPEWKFVPIQTGLDWNTVIQNQTKVGRNTISSTVPAGGSSGIYSAPFSYLSTASGAYDWSTDTYKLCDGTTWYTASEDVVKYYMDPRNAFTPTRIFQFESLAYNSAQKKGVVTAILKDTFMNGTYSYRIGTQNYNRYYNSSFMTAGKTAGVSPYFLAARSRQELGLTRSGAVTGSYPGYEGYYNYFNIGANDSAGGGAIANGLRFAKSGTTWDRPWDNPYKAIIGGAKYIASSYIEKKQNTLYFQKFSVVNSAYLYWHQYMTNVQAPTSEANTTYNAYNNYGILKDSIVFYIPVYNNMPASACPLPAKTGNPNNYLKSLVVKNGTKTLSFNKTFSYNATSYNMVAANGVNSITVSASPVSRFSKNVTGTGTYNISSLAAGQSKTIKVICTAQDGTTRTYTIKVTRASN